LKKRLGREGKRSKIGSERKIEGRECYLQLQFAERKREGGPPKSTLMNSGSG